MRLSNEKILGQGSVAAIVGVGRRDMVTVAACGDRLHSFTGVRLQHKCSSQRVHTARITALSTQRQEGFVPPTKVLFASGGLDGRLGVWGLNAKGTPILAAEIMVGCPVHDVAWCPGGEAEPDLVAAALDSGEVFLWWPDEDRQKRLVASTTPLTCLAWFPDGEHLAVGGEDGVLRIFELPAGAQAKGGLLRHYNAIRQLGVSPCGRYVAFCSEDERGTLFDLSRRESSTFGPDGDALVSLAWHPEQSVLAGGTQQGQSLYYDPATDKLSVAVTLEHLHPAEACAWSPDGSVAWTGSRAGSIFTIRLKDEGFAYVEVHVPTPNGYALSVRWIDGNNLVAGFSSGRVFTFHRPAKGKKGWQQGLQLDKPHTKPVYGLAVSPDGKSVASGSVDKTIKVWDLAERMEVHTLAEIHSRPIYGVAYSPDGRYLATGSADTYLVVYDIAAKKKAAEAKMGQDEYWHFAVRNRILNCVAWAPDGKTLAVGLSNHSVVLLPVTRKGEVSRGATLKAHDDAVSAVAFDPDGKRLVSVGYDRRIVLWQVAEPKQLLSRVVEHTEPIQALAIHPAGRVLATGSWDGTIRLWATADLRQLSVTENPHFSAVEDLAFSRDGALLASASSDGTLGVWRVSEGKAK